MTLWPSQRLSRGVLDQTGRDSDGGSGQAAASARMRRTASYSCGVQRQLLRSLRISRRLLRTIRAAVWSSR